MVKKKFDLSSNMVSIDQASTVDKPDMIKRVTITVAVDLNYRSQIKTWCVKHDMTMQQAFIHAFDQLMQTK